MRVLLIEPRNCWIGLNIALAYIGAALKEAGHEVKVLDFANHRNWPLESTEKKIIEQFKPDLIGIALFYIGYYPVKEMVSRIKQYCSSPIVIGGPQMMIEKENILQDMADLDYAILGDGEDAIVELCDVLEGKRLLQDIDGLIYRENDRVARNKDRQLSNIDRIAFPDYSLFGIEKINRYMIITSRGCPHSCTYCFRSTKKWRPRSPENIIAELKHAKEKYHIDEFVIVDDAFNIQPKRIIRLCELLKKEELIMPWSCTGVRADQMTEALVQCIREAGCYSVNIGVETLQPEIYESLNRNMPIEKVINCVQMLKKYDLFSVGYFMIGLPGDTKEKTWDTYLKAKELGIAFPSFSMLLPMPGTKMYDMIYSREGVVMLRDYRTVSSTWTYTPEFSTMVTAFESPEYSAKDKVEMYNRLRTIKGDPRPPYHKSLIVFGLHAIFFVLKYDLIHSPKTITRLMMNFVNRLIRAKGKHVYKTDIQYNDKFIGSIEGNN